ncbi:MAG: SIS domain-containing protein [Thermomicrobiales bacterium]|nr:SIS domain-containing protein [Thermomicrobiales bacterium]
MSAPERPTSHPFNMHQHMFDQPDAIEQVVPANSERVDRFAATVAELDRLWIVGIGTSYHAALMGEYFFRAFGGGLTAIACHSFDFCLYGPPLTDRDAVIVISHTGRKSYSVDALNRVRESSAALALITGEEGAQRHTDLQHVLTTTAPEGSATYTISYTSALAVLTAIAGAVGERRTGAPVAGIDALTSELPAAMRGALEAEQQIRSLAEVHAGHRKVWLSGAGAAGVSALEAALKIKEASYINAEALPVEQMLHGPFTSVEPEDLMILVAPEGAGQPRTIQLGLAARDLGLDLFVVSDGTATELREGAAGWITVPAIAEPFSALTTLVPLQMLAYWYAITRGTNPDTFRRDDPRFARAYALAPL